MSTAPHTANYQKKGSDGQEPGISADRRAFSRLAFESELGNLDKPSVHHNSSFEAIDATSWLTQYDLCAQRLLDSQYSPLVQMLAAFMNIRLPYQRRSFTVDTSPGPKPTSSSQFDLPRQYIRRLIVTAQDSPSALSAFFGDNWKAGVSCILEEERQNYLFTAKSSGWASTKAAYDIVPDEQTPFLRPLLNPSEKEIQMAEMRWSEWLAMEDWMLGERSPW